MIAILGMISTGLSLASSALGIAKIIKDWNKPASYLIRFINWVGGMVDWFIAKVDTAQTWLEDAKVSVGIKKEKAQAAKEIKKKRRRRYGRWRRKGL